MKGNSAWYHRPYYPLDKARCDGKPFIAALRPGDGSGAAAHALQLWQDEILLRTIPVQPGAITLDGLQNGLVYNVSIHNAADPARQSAPRLFQPGPLIGSVVNYLHPDDPIYSHSGRALCSPSLLVTGGSIFASMDIFQSGRGQNHSLLFRSDNGGKAFEYVTDLMPCFWGKLFWHAGALYIIWAAAAIWISPARVWRKCRLT